VPKVVLAPGLLSTTICCPRPCAICAVARRAMMSVPAPLKSGTITLMGREG
jgi:hypothetical protein